MSNTETEVKTPIKPFFYYPGYNEKFVRRTLAGVVEGGILYVAQAAVFPGFKPKAVPLKLRNGTTVYVVDPGMNPDHFNKQEGRRISTERATGVYTTKSGSTYRAPRQTIIEVPVPEGENPGKVFVGVVETYLAKKGFPAKAPKERKQTPEPNGSAQN